MSDFKQNNNEVNVESKKINNCHKVILSIKDITLIPIFSVLIVISSWISIPFVVPFTLQTFAVFLSLLLLGGFKGTISILIYIILGLIGLPVFANFNGGFAYLLGPTGGYIVGFLLAGVIYWLFEKMSAFKNIWMTILVLFIGLLACYITGTIWFKIAYLNNGEDITILKILSMAVFPFIIPDTIKIILAVLVRNRLKKHINI